MHKKLFIANWKSHKSENEAKAFFAEFKEEIGEGNLNDVSIIIAPPFTLLPVCYELVNKYALPIQLSAQNVSAFPQGAYTGEVNARQVREYAEYVIIGHSERRKYQGESETDIANKAREAKEEGLTVIQCIQDENSVVHKNVDIVAYEPPSAIGSGEPDDPNHIEEVFEILKKDHSEVKFLYGGSVTPETIGRFGSINLDGFLVGGASLSVKSFISLFS